MERQIRSLEALNAEAKRFIDELTVPKGRATLVALQGELGAGKTAFTKAIAHALGIEEVVNSPTFVLEKIYTLPSARRFKRLVHIDAYRLEKGSELTPLGFDELMEDADNLIMMEWPEKVSDALPTPHTTITFTPQPDGSRTLAYA